MRSALQRKSCSDWVTYVVFMLCKRCSDGVTCVVSLRPCLSYTVPYLCLPGCNLATSMATTQRAYLLANNCIPKDQGHLQLVDLWLPAEPRIHCRYAPLALPDSISHCLLGFFVFLKVYNSIYESYFKVPTTTSKCWQAIWRGTCFFISAIAHILTIHIQIVWVCTFCKWRG